MNKKCQLSLFYALKMLMIYGLYTKIAMADTGGRMIAGTQPDKRPQAPVIQNDKKRKGWYTQALTGLQPPYPSNFRFLEDQGVWYTPFIQPGMMAPYDIRGWHQN